MPSKIVQLLLEFINNVVLSLNHSLPLHITCVLISLVSKGLGDVDYGLVVMMHFYGAILQLLPVLLRIRI